MQLSRNRSRLALSPLLALVASCAANGSDASEAIPNLHDRPIVEREGRTLLWANDEEWFDVTDASIDPHTFQFGIGKDTIASIDAPEFALFQDPRVEASGIDRETPVLGVEVAGEARAYPVNLMSMHEVVNDTFAGEPYAILW